MRSAQRFACACVWMLLAGGTLPVVAQLVQGSLTGTVSDASGAVVPRVTVTVTEKDIGFTRTATTGRDGAYLIPLLPPGHYTLTAEKEGFQKYVKGPITLTVDQQAKVDISLTVGAANTTVTVEAAAPVLDTQSYSVGTTVEQTKVEQLPFNGRQFLEATLFTPGVVPGTQGSELNSNRGGSINVNGMRETMNTYLLDGMSDTSIAVGTYSATPPLDSIQEFRMETGVYDAKFGNTPGAQVNMVTKSGTDQFHGSLYEYLRNSDLDARNYFEPTVPAFHRNQFGAALGGPLSLPSIYDGHDRTFFFVNYEGLRDLHDFYSRAHVPDAAEQGGDFSELLPGNPQCPTGRSLLLDPLILFNPAAPLKVPYNMVNLLASSFPSGTLDPVGRGLAGLYPKQNLTPGPCGGENYTAVVNRKVYTNDYVGRFDHRWGTKNTAFFRYNLTTDSEISPSGLPTGVPGFGAYRDDWFTQTGIDWTHTFSPTLLNEAKFGYNRWQYRWSTQDQGNPIASQLGLKGLLTAPRDIGVPNLSFSGFDGMGSDTSFPQAGAVNTFESGDTLTQIHGNHSLAYGFQFRNIKRGNFYEDIRARSQYDFTGVVTGDLVLEGIAQSATNPANPAQGQYYQILTTQVPLLFSNSQGSPCLPSFLGGSAGCAPVANFGNGLADAQFGIPQDWIRGFSGYISGSGSNYDGFAQDTWKARPDLTVTYGLRYEYNTLVTDKYNHLAGFDYNTGVCGSPGALLVAGTNAATLDCFEGTATTAAGAPVGTFVPKGTINLGGTAENRALQRPDHDDFGPRLGFAWQPWRDSKTVVRGGAGVYYDQMVGELYFQKSFNPPFFNLLEGNLQDNELPVLTALSTPPSQGGLPQGTGLFLQNLFTSPSLAGTLFPTSNPVIVNLRDSRVYQWSFDVQRQLGQSWLVDVGYVGTRGLRLPFEWDPNQANNSNPAACLEPSGVACPRPYPDYLAQSYTDSSGKSIYHSLQTKLERHYNNGLAIIAAYTYAKALDTNSTYFSTNANSNFPENSFDRAAEKGRADFDYRHRFSLAYIYDLPFGRTVAHLENSKLNYLIEGWELSGIAMVQSGAPYTATVCCNPSESENGSGGNDRPNVVPGSPVYPAHQTVNQWALPSAFSTPAQFTYGNAGRNTLNGPGTHDWDFSLIRKFKLTESKELEFRAEMFNIFNEANFALPDGNISDTTFGVVGNTVQPIAGQASGGPGDPREIQFALRLRF